MSTATNSAGEQDGAAGQEAGQEAKQQAEQEEAGTAAPATRDDAMPAPVVLQ